MILAPLAPRGWPRAMAPPSMLTLAISSPSSPITARDCAAKASLSSIKSMSSRERPARSSALREAVTGPIPIISGAQPETAALLMRAIGTRSCSAANSSEQTNTKAAPSVRGEAVPAVTVPLASNAGRSLPNPSALVPGLMQPSSCTIPSVVSMGTISPENEPASRALLALA